MTPTQPAIPFREAPLDPPPRARSSPAPWVALGAGAFALVLALAGLWTVIAKGLFEAPAFDAVIPTVCAFLFAFTAIAAIRRAREVTPHRNRTRLAIVLVVCAIVFDLLALGGFVWSRMRPPAPVVPHHSSDSHINLC